MSRLTSHLLTTRENLPRHGHTLLKNLPRPGEPESSVGQIPSPRCTGMLEELLQLKPAGQERHSVEPAWIENVSGGHV